MEGCVILKILIISDTHGKHEAMERVFREESPFDLVIHLGDAEGQEDYIEAIAGGKLEIVAGNNDFSPYLPGEKTIELCGRQIFLTHGHYYLVSAGYGHLINELSGKGYDLILVGHTHRPYANEEGNVLILNPGSLSYPRQIGKKPSYIVLKTEQNQPLNFEIKYLE